jgi:hypothetical protein
VKAEQCRRPEGHGDLVEPRAAKKQSPEAEQDASERRQVWSALSRSRDDEERLLDQQILGDKRLGAAGAEQLSDRGHNVEKQWQQRPQTPQAKATRQLRQDCQDADLSQVLASTRKYAGVRGAQIEPSLVYTQQYV